MHTITVPLDQKDVDRLNNFVSRYGIKKGEFVRRAIENEMKRIAQLSLESDEKIYPFEKLSREQDG
jgi:predicted DNA-binding protein